MTEGLIHTVHYEDIKLLCKNPTRFQTLPWKAADDSWEYFGLWVERPLDAGGTYPSLEELLFTVRGEVNENYPPLQRSLYHKHMSRWYDHFPREQGRGADSCDSCIQKYTWKYTPVSSDQSETYFSQNV